MSRGAVPGRPEAAAAVWGWRHEAEYRQLQDVVRRSRARLGVVIAGLASGALFWFHRPVAGSIAAAFALLQIFLATVASPAVRERAERWVAGFSRAVGMVAAYVTLAPVFFVVVTPMGWWRRRRSDALKRAKEPSRATYFDPAPADHSHARQF